jgi:hypothetical protein
VKTPASDDTMKQLRYLAAALKAPRITEAADRLAEQARDAGWTHEDYLAAVLEREVSARSAFGAVCSPWSGCGVLGSCGRPFSAAGGGEPQRLRGQRAPGHREWTGRYLVGHSSDRATAGPAPRARAHTWLQRARRELRRSDRYLHRRPIPLATAGHRAALGKLLRRGSGCGRGVPAAGLVAGCRYCCPGVAGASAWRPRAADRPARGGVPDRALVRAQYRWQRGDDRKPVNGGANLFVGAASDSGSGLGAAIGPSCGQMRSGAVIVTVPGVSDVRQRHQAGALLTRVLSSGRRPHS